MSARKVTRRRTTCRFSTWLPPGQRESDRAAWYHRIASHRGRDEEDALFFWLQEAANATRYGGRDI